MATWAITGRSASTLTRAVWRASNATNSATTRISLPASIRSWTRPNLTLRQSRIPPPSPKFLRRELSSLLPVHSVIASACLVSKLPSEASTSAEGRFANYLSPI
ncbi:uncharacterized protein LOC105637367 [Jatropha curcas]|uniref:uncharacterized protein LOC105637367 n=1 Tax=Jatropha curcas TaxID=180498 RepID=UPI0005FAA1E1|nr:uncharacterized protein LOC105637367 [Jatropha curcas]